MLQTLINAWKIADLRKKILFTAFILLVFRVGSAITIPFVNIGVDGIIPDAANDSSFLSYLNMMTGNAFNYATILAMSITPYINSSIIMQLLTVAIPALERLQKEGEEGRKKIAAITRYVTIGLGLMQSTAYYFYLRNGGGGASGVATYLQTQADGSFFTGFTGVLQALVIISVLTAGAGLTMWLGERINDKGIGNGVSILLFAGIVARIPSLATSLYSWTRPETNGVKGQYVGYFWRGGPYYFLVPLATIGLLAIVAFIVWMDNAERRIPVQYAKRVVGRKMYGGQSTHIPIKVNMSGVMPVIFASSILSLPPTVEMFISKPSAGWQSFFSVFQQSNWVYVPIYFVLIIGFAYFYSSIQYDPVEMSNNIRKNSGTIPGYRPGQPTADYIKRILSRITLLGALLLSVVALFPIVFSLLSGLVLKAAQFPQVTDSYGNLQNATMSISMGGTSIIIMVGVALETVKQLESQMMMRHYKGFLD
ncbi:MAG: preprotein translocase subunit SecY [Oscillospiraceae bacterium]|jgi:preprotein translocase subunit SecY|nr:preprotein translocase subunit SecY [Oscillospiraceae bacterium]